MVDRRTMSVDPMALVLTSATTPYCMWLGRYVQYSTYCTGLSTVFYHLVFSFSNFLNLVDNGPAFYFGLTIENTFVFPYSK